MNKKKKIGIVVAILAILIILSSIVFALFSAKQKKNAKINIGKIEVVLVEDWPDSEEVPEIGLKRNDKTVKGKSVADKKAYVRMRFIPIVEYHFTGTEKGQEIDEWRTIAVPQEDIKLEFEDGGNWIRQGEYYYYKNILDPYQTTEDLKVSWEILEVPSTVTRYELRTDVRVLLEYSQVSNEAWKEIFQIEDLPNGVER